MKKFGVILLLAAMACAAALPCAAADAPKTVTLKADRLEFKAEAGKPGKVEGTLVQAGEPMHFTAAALAVKKLDDGSLQVDLTDAVLEQVKAAAVGAPSAVEGGMRFTLSAADARAALGKDPGSVTLAGEFNNWNVSDAAATCTLQDGVWTAVVKMAPGKYKYKFVLDGGAKWKEDPSNPDKVDDGFGGSNSIVTVP
jgi:hypothetical protein